MSEAETLYRYNEADEDIARIFDRRLDEIERVMDARQAYVEYLRDRSHERFDKLEKKTRRLQAQGIIIFSGLCGTCGGLGLAAAFGNDWLSMIAILAIGAIFAFFWAVIGR